MSRRTDPTAMAMAIARRLPAWALALVEAVVLAGCDPGGLPDQTDMGPAGVDMPPPPPPAVDSARVKYPDLSAFYERSLQRTCSPNDGVCHRSKQYPDMSTLAGLVSAVDQRCNLLRDDPLTFDNLCEPAGDELQLSAGALGYQGRIGHVRLLPEGAAREAATQVEITLKQPLRDGFLPVETTVALLHADPGLPQLALTFPGVVVEQADAGTNIVVLDAAALRKLKPFPKDGPDRDVSLFDFLSPAKYTPGSPVQVVMGDPNRDGVYGHDLGGRVIKPGDPRLSYLFLRTIMPVTSPSMATNTAPPAPVTESQMPLANFDYWDIDNSAYALYCWIKGLKVGTDGTSNADGPIDYDHCGSLPDDLKPRHQGGEARTWSGIWANVIAQSCATAGCHDRTSRAAELDLSDVHLAHAALVNRQPRQSTDESVKLILPFNPDKSYLMQKLRGTAPAPNDSRMPLGRDLPQRDKAIESIGTWINQGARDD